VVVAAALAAGVWIAGGVVTNDFRTSIALTTVWFAVSGGVCLMVAWRSPAGSRVVSERARVGRHPSNANST
jgi:hypothetical protein